MSGFPRSGRLPALLKRTKSLIVKPARRISRAVGLHHLKKTAVRYVPDSVASAYFVLSERIGTAAYVAPRERSTCPACASHDIEHLRPLALHAVDGRYAGFVSGCRRCGVVFANPMPASEDLDRLYSPEGNWGAPRQAAAGDEKIPPVKYFIDLFRSVSSPFNVEHPAPGSAVLDFGCGSGELLNMFQDFGWTTYGIEPAQKAAFGRHEQLDIIPAEPTFDVVIAHHVLEHVPDPLRIVRSFERCLKPGGMLFISVPRLDGLSEHGDYDYCINDRVHVLSYTRDALAALLSLSGLESMDPVPSQAAHWRDVRRLRMFGQKTGRVLPLPANPLAAAKRAFAAWDARRSPQAARVDETSERRISWRTVRTDAAMVDFRRRRGRRETRGSTIR